MGWKTLTTAVTVAIVLSGCGGGQSAGPSAVPASSKQHAQQHGARPRPQAVAALGSYNVNPSHVYVSGISSGGFMAVQLHFAYSGTFKGAAIYAGGPDYCGQDSETTADIDCGGAGLYTSELAASENYINANQNTSGMDPVSNISGQPVYLWSGTGDTVVPQKTMNDLQTEYQKYGASVTYDNSYDAEHGWESPYGANSCDTLGSPYMIDCSGYDSEKTFLSKFLGTLSTKNTGTLTGSLINFDQTPFGGGSNDLDTNGWVFVPAACASGSSCAVVVVALDGCEQYQAVINDEFVTRSGWIVGGHQQHHRALSVSDHGKQQSQRMLGLVGLHERELRAEVRHPDGCDLQHGQASRGRNEHADARTEPDGDAAANRNPHRRPFGLAQPVRKTDGNAYSDRRPHRHADAAAVAFADAAVLAGRDRNGRPALRGGPDQPLRILTTEPGVRLQHGDHALRL